LFAARAPAQEFSARGPEWVSRAAEQTVLERWSPVAVPESGAPVPGEWSKAVEPVLVSFELSKEWARGSAVPGWKTPEPVAASVHSWLQEKVRARFGRWSSAGFAAALGVHRREDRRSVRG
jgi:hypothetical protein